MGYLSERVSYLRGLVDGIKLDDNSPESRIFGEIIELLDDMAMSIESIDDKQNDISEELAETQEDLYDFLYGDEDVDGDEDEDEFDEDEDDEDYDDFLKDFVCPNCGEVLPVDEELLDSEEEITLECPGCGEKVSITLEDDDDPREDCPGYPLCGGECDTCPAGESLKQ